MSEPHGPDQPPGLEPPTAGCKPPPAGKAVAGEPGGTPAPASDATGTADTPAPQQDVAGVTGTPDTPAPRQDVAGEAPGPAAAAGEPEHGAPMDPSAPPPAWRDEGPTQRLEPPPDTGTSADAGEAATATKGTAAAETAAAEAETVPEPRGADEPRAAESSASPEPVTSVAVPASGSGPDGVPEEAHAEQAAAAPASAPRRRLSSAGALIWLLLALFGFTLVVQLRSNDGDQGLATARQEDLVRILSDLEARDSRLQSEISGLENSQRQLTSGVAGRQAALAEAEKRADELGLLAGTVPGRGPGLQIVMDRVKASAVLNAVQELRGAGGEVMQVAGASGGTVRIVASSYFVDAEGGGIIADGTRLTGPYTLSVIGSPQTMQTALQIPGGVVASVNSAGGSVTMQQRGTVEVTVVRQAGTLQYARPVS